MLCVTIGRLAPDTRHLADPMYDRAALEALVPRLVALRRAESPVSRLDSFVVRGPARLPLVAA